MTPEYAIKVIEQICIEFGDYGDKHKKDIADALVYAKQSLEKQIPLCCQPADVQEVRHGKFISEIVKKEDWRGILRSYYQPNSCSCCHTPLSGEENYCPNCGAKMDLD